MLLVLIAAGCLQQGSASDQAEMKKLFHAATGKKEDKEAEKKLLALGDEAVDFLCGLIRDQKKHEIEITSVDGREKIMTSWGQEAGGFLMAIDTPKVVEELRKLAQHKNPEVRYWGIWTLRSCNTQRMENFAFFRSRMAVETAPRCLEELVGIIANRLDPADVPLFHELLAKSGDLHVKMALWHALGLQGDKAAVLEILKVCETRSGHLGFNYMRELTGRDLESPADWKSCRQWLTGISAAHFRQLVSRRRPAPLPPPLPGRLAYPLPDNVSLEIKEALAWFESLGLPSVKGLTRVCVTDESISQQTKGGSTERVCGWLLEEKADDWRILTGAGAKGPFIWEGDEAWPLEVWEVKERDTTKYGWRSVRRVEKTDFKKEAEALLASLDADRDTLEDGFGQVLSQRAAVFLAGRDCLELGYTDLGMKLLNRAPSMGRDVSELRSLGQMLADEFATAALWRITVDFGVPSIPRETLLAKLETALKQFRGRSGSDRMMEMAERLRTMIATDRAHEAAAKPFDQITKEEQVAELVFQLRNQTGFQNGQPGWCNIFITKTGENSSSPAAKLVALGHAAVPALIATLGSEDYSRAVGFWRDSRFSHTVLTTGDCALSILERIAGRRFPQMKITSSNMSKDDAVKATREDVEKWWAEAQTSKPSKPVKRKTK